MAVWMLDMCLCSNLECVQNPCTFEFYKVTMFGVYMSRKDGEVTFQLTKIESSHFNNHSCLDFKVSSAFIQKSSS